MPFGPRLPRIASWADSLPRIRERHHRIADLVGVALFRGQKAAISRPQQLAGNVLWMLDSMPQSGQADPQRTGTPQNHAPGGNVWPALTSRGHFSRVSYGPSFHRRIEPSSDPNVVHLLASRSRVHQWWLSRAWNQIFRVLLLPGSAPSGFCSCVVFGAPSLSAHFCRCGRPLDVRGHHRSACGRAGVLGRRGFPLESAAVRLCREAGGRVSVNVLVADLDLLPHGWFDNWKIEVVVDGLPLFHGAQLAVDATLVLSEGMGVLVASVLTTMEQVWSKHDARRKTPTQSWPAHGAAEHVWWCWVAKLVGDGPMRLEIS